MCDYYVHSENFTENELIIDHVHESREMNELLHESREYFRSRITGNNFVLSRFTAIKNKHSQFTKNPLSDPLQRFSLKLIWQSPHDFADIIIFRFRFR